MATCDIRSRAEHAKICMGCVKAVCGNGIYLKVEMHSNCEGDLQVECNQGIAGSQFSLPKDFIVCG